MDAGGMLVAFAGIGALGFGGYILYKKIEQNSSTNNISTTNSIVSSIANNNSAALTSLANSYQTQIKNLQTSLEAANQANTKLQNNLTQNSSDAALYTTIGNAATGLANAVSSIWTSYVKSDTDTNAALIKAGYYYNSKGELVKLGT